VNGFRRGSSHLQFRPICICGSVARDLLSPLRKAQSKVFRGDVSGTRHCHFIDVDWVATTADGGGRRSAAIIASATEGIHLAYETSIDNAGKRDAYVDSMASSICRPKPCVLVIDDEAGFRSFLSDALEDQGYRVIAASSPQEAIQIYQERWREIDVVLLDYWLPPMTGTSVFDELQRLNPDVRVVLVTGCHDPVAARMFKKGLRGYLKKPFSLPELAQKVRDAINAPVVPTATSIPVCDASPADNTISTQRHLPDPEICRTKYRGDSLGISYCLVENPNACGFSVRLGSSVFCRHPDRRTFEKTDPLNLLR